MVKSKERRRGQKLTEDQKLRRRAERKAVTMNAAAQADAGPLFADQVPLTTASQEYWKMRRSWALVPRGQEAAYLGQVEYRLDLMIIRNLAKQVMTPADFALACEKSDQMGSAMDFWKNILLGRRRIVVAYDVVRHGWQPCFSENDAVVCCQHGCSKCEPKLICYIERSTITEKLVWPPAGYEAPLTAEQLDNYLALPEPAEFAGQVDPLGLR